MRQPLLFERCMPSYCLGCVWGPVAGPLGALASPCLAAAIWQHTDASHLCLLNHTLAPAAAPAAAAPCPVPRGCVCLITPLPRLPILLLLPPAQSPEAVSS